jgi:hypothetical protein
MPLRNSASTAPRDFLFVVPIAWRNMNSAVRRVKQVPPSSLMHTIAAKVCFLWRFGEVPRMEQTRSFSLYRLVKIRERRANGVQTTLLPAGRISAVKFRDERLKATSSRLHSEGRRPRPLSVRRPIEVVVLNCWVTETKDTPRLSKTSMLIAV